MTKTTQKCANVVEANLVLNFLIILRSNLFRDLIALIVRAFVVRYQHFTINVRYKNVTQSEFFFAYKNVTQVSGFLDVKT